MREDSDLRIFQKIQQFVSLNNQTVLEIGCGDGRISRFIANKTDKLVGVDPGGNKIKDARVNVPKGKFLIGSGENLKFSDDFFDLVIFTLSLHHQNSKKAIKEAKRVLKRDGLILVIEPLIEGEIERVFAIVYNENQATLDAQQAIMESGLDVERSEVFYAYWIFESKKEMCESIFNYYEMSFNSVLEQKIYDFLESNIKHKSLKLTDSMIIHSLSKKAQSDKGEILDKEIRGQVSA